MFKAVRFSTPLYRSTITTTSFSPTTVRPVITPTLIRVVQNFSTGKMSGVSDVVIKDHRELEDYYSKIMSACADDYDTMTRWQHQFVWELARHSIGEELVVYPAMEKYLGDRGKQFADKDRTEHQEIKVMLKKFQSMSSSSPEFRPTLETLMSTLRRHINEEETNDLPALEAALASSSNVKETEKLAKSFQRTKMFAPTRSHPNAPDKPPFETVVGLLTAPVDKLRDLFMKFP